MSSERFAFRADIEGLRGVAILLVVLFHARVPALAGGFVGVDVFFVLSGFFITGLLARELGDTGKVDVADFYATRAMRLLPVLGVVLVATLVLVMWLYAPIDRAPIAANARSVALFSGNIELAQRNVDYFRSADNPLLHTWSLAVEEQFYLVWPLLFLLAAMMTSDDTMAARRRLLIGVAGAAVISFAISIGNTRTSPSYAFFSLTTRLWEFALGGLVALLLPVDGKDRNGAWLQVAGLAALGAAVAMYDKGTPYPGTAALLPAAAAVALIVGGQWSSTSAVSMALSAPVLRWLGRVSYAWYLWHWPLIGLAGVLNPQIGPWGKVVWAVGALVLAWLTHRFIESPARDSKLSRSSPATITQVALFASVALAILAHGALLVADWQASTPAQRTFAAARIDRMQHGCWAQTVADLTKNCEFGDRAGSRTVVLLGDSHAEHWLGALDRIGRERGWKIVTMIKGGCPVADIRMLATGRMRERHYGECVRYREETIRRTLALRPDAVILSSWDHYIPVDGKPADWQVSADAWRKGLRRTYSRFSVAGIPTAVIRGTPRTWFDVPSCLSRRAARLPFARACEYDRDASLSPAARDAQTRAADGLHVRFVNMNDQICGSPRCAVQRNGLIVFTDDNHLTATFSRSVAPVLARRLESAFPRSFQSPAPR